MRPRRRLPVPVSPPVGYWPPVPETPPAPDLDDLFRWRRGDVVAMVLVIAAGAVAFLVMLLPG